MRKRVVVTGMGVVAPNANNLIAFKEALLKGKSGIKHIPQLQELSFACQVAGIPEITQEHKANYFDELTLKSLKSTGIIYGCIAAIDAWKDAQLLEKQQEPLWDTGCIFGNGLTGADSLRDAIYMVDDKKVKRLGSRLVEQTMSSGISAYLGGIFGLGNQVTTNSSACSTGSEAILMAYERIAAGKAARMITGSCDSQGPYIWGGFDSMRVLNRKSNENPEQASAPMSSSAAGFIPGAGAGALILEDLDTALERGATIYGEILGGYVNSGGQCAPGTMTAPNPNGVVNCITNALKDADVSPNEIDAIGGHLTSTMGDVLEVQNWAKALSRNGKNFPAINSLKSLIGHCLGAAGSIEMVALLLQLKHGFFHGTKNCNNPHEEILKVADKSKLPVETLLETDFNVIAKSSFGFGDVNCCLVMKKFTD